MKLNWRIAGGSTGLLAALLYGASSISLTFLNKAVLSSYDFNFPFLVLTLQILVTIATLEVLCHLEVISLPPYTLRQGLDFLWPSVFCALHSSLSLYALQGLNVPMYGAIKRCAPLVTMLLSARLLNKPPAPAPLKLSVGVITVGCLLAGLGDLSFSGRSYTLGVLCVLAQSSYLTLVQLHSETRHLSSLHVLQLNSYNTLWLYLPLCLFFEGGALGVVVSRQKEDGSFLVVLAALILVGSVFNYALFICTVVNCALTTAMVGVVKNCLQTVLGFFLLGGVAFHALNVVGLVMNSVGGILYIYVKTQQNITNTKPPLPLFNKDEKEKPTSLRRNSSDLFGYKTGAYIRSFFSRVTYCDSINNIRHL